MPLVLCDAGPLMALGKLNRLDLLADLYEEVQVTRAVYEEVVVQGLARGASATPRPTCLSRPLRGRLRPAGRHHEYGTQAPAPGQLT